MTVSFKGAANMEYRKLGASGLKVSPICLGTMMFGERTDAAEAGRIVDSARAAGINFIDTADAYAKGESERITGKLIAGDREHWVLATKVGNPMGKGPNDTGLSRAWMMRAIDASLQRLNTDWVDIYYLHLDDAVDADRGDARRHGRDHRRGQGALFRRLQLPRLAHRADRRTAAGSSACPRPSSASPTTTR